MIFSPLNPTTLKINIGNENEINIKIFIFIFKLNNFRKIRIIKIHNIFKIAVE